jgi:hypothetical protein
MMHYRIEPRRGVLAMRTMKQTKKEVAAIKRIFMQIYGGKK